MDPISGILAKSPRSVRTLTRLLLLGIVFLVIPGCVFDKLFPPEHGIQPLEANVSQTALIEHLNRNARNLHSWSCTDATISVRASKYLPVKIPLTANIAVERDKNFRLLATSPMGNEADIGSNSERFWFWMRRNSPPHVFTARHEDMDTVGQRLQIPFHPTWIMEALGVVPLDPNTITVQQQGNQPHTMLLVSQEVSPSGASVRREIVVDTRLGVILAHRLFDASGQRMAEARLSRHRREPSGIVMPHIIELDWPQHQMAMTLELSNIEVNPSHLAQQTWQLPVIPGCREFDMGRRVEHVEIPPPHVPAGERTTQSNTWLEPPPFAESPGEADWHATSTPGRTAVRSEPEPPPFY
jgi:hypothetical protein